MTYRVKRSQSRIRLETEKAARTVALYEVEVYNHGDNGSLGYLKKNASKEKHCINYKL